MKIQYVDELFITTPMSQEERYALLKSFREQSYIQGIDKGTELERDTQFKLQKIKEQKIRKEFNEIFERLSEYVHVGVKRHKRLKYKGRYTKNKSTDSPSAMKTTENLTISYKLPDWLR